MTPTAAALSVGVPNVLVTFAYDYLSRRIGKTIVNRAVTPHSSEQISYLYDHWNPVAEWRRTSAAPALALTRTHLWGLDIGSSGKVEAGTPVAFQSAGLAAKASATAGGVAGLIASTYHATGGTRTAQLPSYDANGNIIAWTTASGNLLRKIDYDAFGNEVIVENFAPTAETNKLPAFGFSTKPKDPETGLSYYGYRYYDPVTGRWPSRDPIGEDGGVNLYGFVGNGSVNHLDYLGLLTIEVQKCQAYLYIGHAPKTPIKWLFLKGYGCGAIGGAVVCWPERNNRVPEHPSDDGDPENRHNNWPNIPQHDNPLIPQQYDPLTGDPAPGAEKLNDDQINRNNDNNQPNYEKDESAEHSFQEAIRNALSAKSFIEIKKRLCDCCKEDGIDVIIYIDTSEESSDSLNRFGLKPKENKFHLDCPKE